MREVLKHSGLEILFRHPFVCFGSGLDGNHVGSDALCRAVQNTLSIFSRFGAYEGARLHVHDAKCRKEDGYGHQHNAETELVGDDLSGLEETIGVLANIEGALEYKVYKNETAGLKISLDTRKLAECSMLAEYIDNFGTMEGFKMTAQDYAAFNETFGKFDLEAVVLFDDVSRITSLTMSIDANVTSYDSYYDSVTNTEVKEKDNTTIVKGKSKITANYDGMKKTPAKEHKDYVSVMSFVEEYEDLLEPAK